MRRTKITLLILVVTLQVSGIYMTIYNDVYNIRTTEDYNDGWEFDFDQVESY